MSVKLGRSVATPHCVHSASAQCATPQCLIVLFPSTSLASSASSSSMMTGAVTQGLTLVHFSAQLKRILSNRDAFRDS